MDELELIVEEVVEVSLTMSDQPCKLCNVLLRVVEVSLTMSDQLKTM